MKYREIKAKKLKPKKFIDEKVEEIREAVGDGMAINALSGGVDSSVVTMLWRTGRWATAQDRLRRERPDARGRARAGRRPFSRNSASPSRSSTRARSSSRPARDHRPRGEARGHHPDLLQGRVRAHSCRKSGASVLLQGTILTDVDETVAGIKRQHNVFEQLGIDPQEAFGYRILEPLIQLRKDGVRKVGAGPRAAGRRSSTASRSRARRWRRA